MYTLINGIEMNKLYPDTFSIPSMQQKQNLKVGNSVKIGVCPIKGQNNERFWMTVSEISDDTIIGIVDNDLILSEFHGIFYKDTMIVKFENILDIIC